MPRSLLLPGAGLRCSALLAICLTVSLAEAADVVLGAPALRICLDPASGAVTAVQAAAENLGSAAASAAGGFSIEDAAAGTPPEAARGALTPSADGADLTAVASQARIEVTASYRVQAETILVSGTVKDRTGGDRAIVLRFRLPLAGSAQRWVWDDDIVSSRPTDQDGVYESTQKLNYDHIEASRWASRYPLCALHTASAGLSVAVPLDPPRVCILRYVRQGATGFLELAFEFGLAPETRKFPSQASFAFAIYPHDPAWGFRAALERYYRLYPASFRSNARRAGLWFINTDPESVERPWDFHFMFDEVATLRPAKVRFDNLFDYYALHYVEPWGRWHFFGAHPVQQRAHSPEDVGVDPDELTQRFLSSDLARERPDIAEWIRRSAAYGPQGKWLWLRWFDVYRPGDWTSFILTISDPDIPGGNGEANLQGVRDAFALKCFPGGYADWARQQELRVDGVYLDSIGGWAGFLPDSFRRDLWPYADLPLLFDHQSKRPVQNHAMGNWEFVKALSDRLRQEGRLLIANAHPPVDAMFYPLLDMIGAEAGGESFSAPRARRAYMRSYAYHKPVSWLDYNDGGYTDSKVPLERKEWAMQRCLPYALFPGTGNFWESHREGYEAVRPLYRRYLPLFEELAVAGWEPIPYAACRPASPEWVVERFGNMAKQGALYVAIGSDRETPGGEVSVVLDSAPLGLPESGPGAGVAIHELVSGVELAPSAWSGGRASFRLAFTAPWQTQIIRIARLDYLAELYAGRARRAGRDAQAYLSWRSLPHANEGRNGSTGQPLDPADTEANRQQIKADMDRLAIGPWLTALEASTRDPAADPAAALQECGRVSQAAAGMAPAVVWQAIAERADTAAAMLRQAYAYRARVPR